MCRKIATVRKSNKPKTVERGSEELSSWGWDKKFEKMSKMVILDFFVLLPIQSAYFRVSPHGWVCWDFYPTTLCRERESYSHRFSCTSSRDHNSGRFTNLPTKAAAVILDLEQLGTFIRRTLSEECQGQISQPWPLSKDGLLDHQVVVGSVPDALKLSFLLGYCQWRIWMSYMLVLGYDAL